MAYIGNEPAKLAIDLDNGVVTTTKLANDSITAAKIVDGTIVADDLGSGIVTNGKVASNAAIAASKLAISGGSNITLQSDGTFDLDATVDVTGGYSVGGNAVINSSRAITAVSLATTSNATVGGALSAVGITNTGKLTLNDPSFGGWIQSNTSVRIDIDNDNNQTDRAFVVSKNNGATSLLTILEDASATFSGNVQGSRLGANATPNSNYAVNALQSGSMTHAGYFQANGDDFGVEVNATASGGYSSSVLYVRQSSRNSGGNLARFANSDGDKVLIGTDGFMGIGTGSSTIESPLHVKSNTTGNTNQLLLQNAASGDVAIKFNKTGHTYFIGIDSADNGFKISDNGQGVGFADDRLSISTTGMPTFKSDNHTNLSVTSGDGSTTAFMQTVQGTDARIGTSTNHPLYLAQNGQFRLAIDTNGNVMVGKTSSDFTTAGVELAQGGTAGKVQMMRADGALTVVNTTNDGAAISVYKGTTLQGVVGTVTTDLYVGTGDTGIRFNDAVNGVLPFNTTTEAQVDGQLDLGFSSVRWRNLYLSAAAFADNYQFAQNSSAGSATEAIYRNTTGQITIRAGSEDLVRVDGANDIVDLGGLPAGSVRTHGVIATNKAKATLGTNLGDTMRVFAVHGQTANSDFLTFGSRRITAGQSGWNHSVWDITRDVDNTSNLYRYMTFGIGETVINDYGDTTMNFRVETGQNQNALKVLAPTNAMTIGQSSPSTVADGFYFAGMNATHRHFVGVNTNTASSNSLVYLNRHNASGGVHIEFRTNNAPKGTITSNSSGTFYATTSDRRLKEDIAPVSGASALLEKMNPVSFRWIEKPDGDYEFGFIAQEMAEVMPEAVIGSEDEMTAADSPDGEGKPVYMQMDYGRITPIIVAALKEANKEIADLQERIKVLEEA